jgi:hypothetical protein
MFSIRNLAAPTIRTMARRSANCLTLLKFGKIPTLRLGDDKRVPARIKRKKVKKRRVFLRSRAPDFAAEEAACGKQMADS